LSASATPSNSNARIRSLLPRRCYFRSSSCRMAAAG
jgi:hypothetical protein